MAYELTVTSTGGLQLTVTGASIERVLKDAREVVPDIDERYTDLLSTFRIGRGGDDEAGPADVPGDADPGDDEAGTPDSDSGVGGPAAQEREEVEAPTQEVNEDTCAVCAGPVPPDFAGLMRNMHGEAFCPTHGKL